VSFIILSYSCTYDVAEPVIVCKTPDTISFGRDIIPILNAECNTNGCHSGNSPSGGLNLEQAFAYKELMKSGSGYIDTVITKYSVLYAQMNSKSNPMPPKGKLDACKIDLVFKWIQQRAKNN